QGLNIFGSKLETFATAEDLRESDFTIARVHYLHLLRFNETWTLRSDGYAQYSAQVLPSIKQFKVGGNRIGRGFEAAAVSGDRGAGVKLELKRVLHAQPSWFRVGGIYGFYDLGAAWRNDQGGRQSAASAGIGIAMNGNVLAGYLELAKPLTHVDVDGNKDAAIFVELSFTF
ncbi:MAG: ShlB/FhaC/HecB family hemolysin secretion/activation protein, partial [Woeseiaceae bacterium]